MGPAVPGGSKSPEEVLRQRLEEQGQLLQKERGIAQSLHKAVVGFSKPGGSAGVSSQGTVPGQQYLLDVPSAPYTLIPHCLTDYTLKCVLFCFSNKALGQILLKTAVHQVFQGCMLPVLKCLVNKNCPASQWRSVRVHLPAELSEVQWCWQLYQFTLLAGYAEIPGPGETTGELWSEFVPHAIGYMFEYVLKSTAAGQASLNPNMTIELRQCLESYGVAVPASFAPSYELLFLRLFESTVLYVNKQTAV